MGTAFQNFKKSDVLSGCWVFDHLTCPAQFERHDNLPCLSVNDMRDIVSVGVALRTRQMVEAVFRFVERDDFTPFVFENVIESAVGARTNVQKHDVAFHPTSPLAVCGLVIRRNIQSIGIVYHI